MSDLDLDAVRKKASDVGKRVAEIPRGKRRIAGLDLQKFAKQAAEVAELVAGAEVGGHRVRDVEFQKLVEHVNELSERVADSDFADRVADIRPGGGSVRDSDLRKFAKQVSEFADRVADVSDAARGKARTRRSRSRARWLLVPAAGAAVYAVSKRTNAGRSARRITRRAKDRAANLPDADLMSRAKDVVATSSRGDHDERRENRRERPARRGTSRIDARELEAHRRERAERRDRRRESMAAS